MDSQTAPIIAALVTYLYWLVTEWVGLPPWNDVSTSSAGEKMVATLVNALPFALLAIGFASNILLFEAPGILYFIVWLGVQLVRWWSPYLQGASPKQLEEYTRRYGRTSHFLPARGNNPVPDSRHVVLHILSLITLVVALGAAIIG